MFHVLAQYINLKGGASVSETTTNRYHHTREYNPTYTKDLIIDDIARQISDMSFETKLYDEYGTPKYDLLLDTPMDDSFSPGILIEEEKDNIYKAMVNEEPKELVITDSLLVSSFIQDKETLAVESAKIIAYLTKYFIDNDQNEVSAKIYGDLRFIYHNGYVYVYRSDIPLKDVITEEMFSDDTSEPQLKHLGNMTFGEPINHDMLRQIILMRPIQFFVQDDKEKFIEAKKILSQEYVIALNPQPRYQLWTLIQLIKLWYCDDGMQNYVKKIKLLINQWEANSEIPFNKERGIKPSIAVYPRYGKKAATTVIKRVVNYFFPYINAITWKDAKPDHFKASVIPLISYTSTNDTMKSFYSKVIKSVEKETNLLESANYTNMDLEFPSIKLQRFD